MNISSIQTTEPLASLFQALGSPARLAILLTIGKNEICVCHIEEALNLRQAYISQQLMELRKAGLLLDRREGRYIHYRLSDPKILDLLSAGSSLLGDDPKMLEALTYTEEMFACAGNTCAPKPNFEVNTDAN